MTDLNYNKFEAIARQAKVNLLVTQRDTGAWTRGSIRRDNERFEARVQARLEARLRVADLGRALEWVRGGNWYWLHKIDVSEADLRLLGYVDDNHEITDAGRAALRGEP